jgi:hypothetical protein
MNSSTFNSDADLYAWNCARMIRLAFATTLALLAAFASLLPQYNFLAGLTRGGWFFSGVQMTVVQARTPTGALGPVAQMRATSDDGVAVFTLDGQEVPEGNIVFSVYLRGTDSLQLNLFADERSFASFRPTTDGWIRVEAKGYHSRRRPIRVNIGGVHSFKAGAFVEAWEPQLNWGTTPGWARVSSVKGNTALGMVGGLPLWIALVGTAIGWIAYECTGAVTRPRVSVSHGQYVGTILLGTLLVIAGAGSTVWMINPLHRLLTTDRQKAFCDPAALSGVSGWSAKALVFQNERYDAIIVGSSKIFYVDPALYKYYHFVNGGLGAATPEALYELLDAYAVNVKVVVLALDFYMFNEARFGYSSADQLKELSDRFRAPHDERSPFEVLLSSIKQNIPYLLSVKVLTQGLLGTNKTTHREPRLMPRGNLNVSGRLDDQDRRERSEGQQIKRIPYDLQLQVLRTHYMPYVFSDRRIDDLKKIRDLMAQRGIPLLVQINPVNAEEKALIDSLPSRVEFDRYRSAVQQVFPTVSDYSGPEYANPKYYFDADPIHFLPSTGAMLVNQQLEKSVSQEQRQMYESQSLKEESRAPALPCDE